MNSAIILAGGSGRRVESSIPKQFIEINNTKIINYSIQAFEKNKNINEIILVLNENWIDKVKNEYKKYKLVVGGNTRYQSSLNGILHCSKECKNVLIHDAARPLLSQKIIDACINNLSDYEATTPFLHMSDSLIIKDKNIIKYIDRDLIKNIQTPQGFNKNIIKDALENTKSYGTDDISTLLDYNSKVKIKFFNGEKYNFKITNNFDLQIFKSIINEK